MSIEIELLQTVLEEYHGKVTNEVMADKAGISVTTLKRYMKQLGYAKNSEINKSKIEETRRDILNYLTLAGESKSLQDIGDYIGKQPRTCGDCIKIMMQENINIVQSIGKKGKRYYEVVNDIEYKQPYARIEPEIECIALSEYHKMPTFIRAITPFNKHKINARKIDGVDNINSIRGEIARLSREKNKLTHIDRQLTMRKAGAIFTGSTSMDI
jgi:DNA-binding Lrp family transcriptional regulator